MINAAETSGIIFTTIYIYYTIWRIICVWHKSSEGVENAQEISLAVIIKEKLNEFKDELLTEI